MAAGGDPMMDPMAAGGEMPPMPEGEELPPLPEEGGEGEAGEDAITGADADTMKNIQMNTMDIVKQTLDMVDFKRKKDEEGAPAEATATATETVEEPAPEAGVEALPEAGPVTGQPLPPADDQMSGPLDLAPKTAAALAKLSANQTNEAQSMASTTGEDCCEGDIGDDTGEDVKRMSAGKTVGMATNKLAAILAKQAKSSCGGGSGMKRTAWGKGLKKIKRKED